MTCDMREYCLLKNCEEERSNHIYKLFFASKTDMAEDVCTCRTCLKNSTEEQRKKGCGWSGDAYNTDGGCLAEK